jgi:pSer/pThr/pTyr-binding forkhead associated (FHA) protein
VIENDMTDTRYFIKKVTTGREIPIASLMSIGRSEDSALRLLEGQPSRHHARITLDPGGAFIEDLGSTNGTFVNGRRLDAKVKQKLSGGDSVRFDVEEFVFVAPAAAPAADSDKTVFRPPADEKTVFRPPAAEAKPAGAEKPPEARPVGAERSPADAKPAGAPRPAAEKREGAAADSGDRPAHRAAETPAPRDLPGSFVEPKSNATVWVTPRKAAQGVSAAPVPAHAAGDPPYFWVESGASAGKKIELTSESAAKGWRIGSGADCGVRFDDAGVSGSHARLAHENATWLLTDDLSVNGTYVNDKKTLKSYLANGDRVRFGPVECRFFVPAPGARAAGAGGSLWRRYGVLAAAAFALTLALLLIAYRFMK